MTRNKLQGMIMWVLVVILATIMAILLITGSSHDETPDDETSVETTCVTTSTTETTTSTSTTITTTTLTTTETTTVTTETTQTIDPIDYLNYLGEFRGTYYHGYINPCNGGSGRMLEDCTPKDSEMKGSIACRYIQENFGYGVNGRTRVYLELPEYPEMNGFYYVDDACLSYDVVDFYFIEYENCPWENGIPPKVNLYIES